MKLSTRLTLAMVGLVLFTTAATGILAYRNLLGVAVPRSLERLDQHVRLLASELDAVVRGARADVLAFAVDEMVIGSSGDLADRSNVFAAAERRRLESRFSAELTAKPWYDELRIIGIADGGREIIRVDRSGAGGAIRALPDSELQRGGDRDYFQKTMALAAGDVYISPIELETTRGVVDTPRVPTSRVAAPLFTPDGRRFGIVIANLDLRPVFDRIRWSVRPGSHIYVVNDSGDYLLHPDVNREFGFQLGSPARVSDEYPGLMELLQSDAREPRILQNRSGARVGVAWQKLRLGGGPRVAAIETLSYPALIAGATTIRDASAIAALAAVLVAFVLAVFIARSMTKPLAQMTRAVERLADNEPMVIHTAAGGEIGTLAKAFARMDAEVREKTAALTREIEERSRLFDLSPDLILTTNHEGKILRVSPSCRAIVGYEPKELVGRNGAEFVYPRDLEAARAEIRMARRGEQRRNFETPWIHKDGRVIPMAWSCVWSDAEQCHFFIGRDMTEAKKAEEALLDSERMARTIIDTALDAIIQVNESGEVLEWNPQAESILGWSREEAMGRPITDLYLPKGYRPRYLSMNELLRQVGRVEGERFEIDALRKDGHKIKVEISMSGVRRRDGNIYNLLLRDITGKIAAEEQMRQSQKMEAVGQLTGGIAHDFNNVLTAITSIIGILADGVADKPQLVEATKLITAASRRGAELTRRLLAFARKQPLEPRETDVNALIVNAQKLFRPALGEQVEIEVSLDEHAWPALVDPTQLTTALLNLAVNARDAMPKGGKLTLETCNVVLDETYTGSHAEVTPGEYVMIAVSDTGTGIPAAIRDKIFDPFFSTKGVGKGTGLGLSMVYGFVKQSGGQIDVYSEEGLGTSIKLYLPRASAPEEVVAEAAAPSLIEGGMETILVVEDDALVRRSVTTQIQSLGYQTISVGSGAEALQVVERGDSFDLLFTDVIMPGSLNGRELADEVLKRRPGMKVLFTSGYTEDAIFHHGRLDAGVLLLAKPYSKAEIARMIRQALTAA
jgi:PAS domain S-box-containing protein